MSERKQYDFDKAAKLLGIYEQSIKHGSGPAQKIGTAAMEELRAMVEEHEKPEPKVVTPPAGPENSAIQQSDGSLDPIPPANTPRPRAQTLPDGALKAQELERRAQEGQPGARPDGTPGQPNAVDPQQRRDHFEANRNPEEDKKNPNLAEQRTPAQHREDFQRQMQEPRQPEGELPRREI